MFRVNKLLWKQSPGCVVWSMQVARCTERVETCLTPGCALPPFSALHPTLVGSQEQSAFSNTLLLRWGIHSAFCSSGYHSQICVLGCQGCVLVRQPRTRPIFQKKSLEYRSCEFPCSGSALGGGCGSDTEHKAAPTPPWVPCQWHQHSSPALWPRTTAGPRGRSFSCAALTEVSVKTFQKWFWNLRKHTSAITISFTMKPNSLYITALKLRSKVQINSLILTVASGTSWYLWEMLQACSWALNKKIMNFVDCEQSSTLF